METSKKTIIIVIAVVVVLIIAVGGYFGWIRWKESDKLSSDANGLDAIGDASDQIIDDAIKGALPSIQTNPLEDKPDVNPASKTNPFSNIKTNPFD
ncbi:MAG: hypothetical protein WC845_01210 [Candidatus Staskawiczbacteria bacterium]|jgi:hypothetical protein